MNQLARAKQTSEFFAISRSTLWLWVKQRREEGFPQPIKAGPRTTLFDVDAISAYLKQQGTKGETK